MIIKYNVEIDNEVIIKDITRLTNLIFKLLPNREEGLEWKAPLENLIIELVGLSRLLESVQFDFLILLSKLEALLTLDKEDDFLAFRRTIFDCLSLLSGVKECLAG